MKVTKRSGNLEDFDITKTKQVISWACEGLDVNPLELESQIDIIFKDGISTSDIQDNLITHSLSLISKEYPDWQIVAGRLTIMPRWKSLKNKNLYQHISSFVEKGFYNPDLLNKYTEGQINLLEKYIDNSRDLVYNYAGVINIINKYLLPDEPLQYLFMTSAMVLSNGDIEKTIKFYNQGSLRKNTLISKKVRLKDASLSSCFIIKAEDNLESIFHCITQTAKISKNGGGVGIYLSDIRGNGSNIRYIKKASNGVLPWIKLFNDTAIAVNQLGKRAGAVTVALDCWHIDLMDFLNIQVEHGEQRLKSFDVFPQIVINNIFLDSCREDLNWYLFDPHEIKTKFNIDLVNMYDIDFEKNYIYLTGNLDKIENYKVYKAKDIMRQIMMTMVETGLPYLFNKDEANKHNPNKHKGLIYCGNLCQESFSITNLSNAHTCDLLSINLSEINSLEELKDVASSCVDILDRMIDLGNEPIEESNNHHTRYRVLGIGTTGLHDYLVKRGYTYEKAQREGIIKDLYEFIQYHLINRSADLAEILEPYSEFIGSEWESGDRIDYFKSNSNLELGLDWDRLQEKIESNGIRNSQLSAIAPGTSNAIALGSTPSCFPSFSPFYYDANLNGNIPIVAPYLKGNELLYKKYKDFNHDFMTDVISDIQKYICSGISYETIWDLNDANITAKTLYSFILDSFDKGVKALYYTRFIQKDSTKNINEVCVSCTE